jgi:predicted glycosyltransferase
VRRLLIYTQDGTGLGHLKRALNVARGIDATTTDWKIVLLADSPAVGLVCSSEVEYVKLPTIIKTGGMTWRPHRSSLEISKIIGIRSRTIQDFFFEFRPDVFLVDHMPVGALGELRPLLDRVLERRDRSRLVLGLRDILDEPSVVRDVWGKLDAYRYIGGYDTVLVYGCRDIYDPGCAYDLASHAEQLVYCNYVASPPADGPLGERSFEEPLIVVMGGGGADLFPLARVLLQAVPEVLRHLRFRVVLLIGPNMPRAHRSELEARARTLPVRVIGGLSDARAWIRRADAVVTMAGYNSVCESLLARRKVLAVPRPGPSSEQRTRASLFGARRLLSALPPEDLTAPILRDALLELLDDGQPPDRARLPPMDGAQRAASVILAD